MIKLRIQAGVETYRSGRRISRMTPVDQTLEVQPMVADTFLLLASIADTRDLQPGDGEVDVTIGTLDKLASTAGVPELVVQAAEYAETIGMVGSDINLFVRVTRTE